MSMSSCSNLLHVDACLALIFQHALSSRNNSTRQFSNAMGRALSSPQCLCFLVLEPQMDCVQHASCEAQHLRLLLMVHSLWQRMMHRLACEKQGNILVEHIRREVAHLQQGPCLGGVCPSCFCLSVCPVWAVCLFAGGMLWTSLVSALKGMIVDATEEESGCFAKQEKLEASAQTRDSHSHAVAKRCEHSCSQGAAEQMRVMLIFPCTMSRYLQIWSL